jgi:hypothetical protein
MDMFIEAGIGALASLVTCVCGLVAIAKNGQATTWAIATLTAGLVGAGLGQRMVSRAAELAPTLSDKVDILAVGAREATGNLIISGVMVAALLLGGAIAKHLRPAT